MTGKATQYENSFASMNRYYHTMAYSPKPRQFALLVTDITEQKQIQAALTESTERFQAIFEQSPARDRILRCHWHPDVCQRSLHPFVRRPGRDRSAPLHTLRQPQPDAADHSSG
ncbi:MAG: hypothetical protein MZU97_08620 [Bacillus subtilis]|nr:hypothetical protein [Bacillus subtilis]